MAKSAKSAGLSVSIMPPKGSDEEKESLPHLHGFPLYQWSYDFIHSNNSHNFVCAANQISKSSTNIRKCIYWATEPLLWPKLWKTTPTMFFYFYPNKDVATVEFEQKWVKEFLPRGAMKDHPFYGWRANFEYKKIHSIEFNSGVTVYIKSYEQKLTALQSSSVYAVFGDEEMPTKVYDEIFPRLWATEGYFHMVFTATIGQEFWRRTIEETGTKEMFKGAFKRQVSKYDCLTYMDGSPSPWTIERIKKEEAACRNQTEIDRRIHGKFILDRNKLFSGFDRTKNTRPRDFIRPNWLHFCGVFFGRGSKLREAAIVFLRVDPKMCLAEVVDGWCGGDEGTSALDVFVRFKQMSKDMALSGCFSDVRSADFIRLANSSGGSFQPIRIPSDNGDKLINSLFKSEMLRIIERKSTEKLILQIEGVKRSDEDLVAFEYAGAMITVVSKLPWNFADVVKDDAPPKDPYEYMCERQRFYAGVDRPELDRADDYEKEFDEANQAYGDSGFEDF